MESNAAAIKVEESRTTIDGHVHGNFKNYYAFHPISDRLQFLTPAFRDSMHRIVLDEAKNNNTSNPILKCCDLGCNDGELSLALYDFLSKDILEENPRKRAKVAFDANSLSEINDLAQRQKRVVEYVQTNDHDLSESAGFSFSIFIDRVFYGAGCSISKKNAKSKAANEALSRIKNIGEKKENLLKKEDSALKTSSNDQEACIDLVNIFLLGIDLDSELITRAKKKMSKARNVQFEACNLMNESLNDCVVRYVPPSNQPTFHLITCFGLTMWIHLNYGDQGLHRFLVQISSMTQCLLIEPQEWKCYRNAFRRLNRLTSTFKFDLNQLTLRENVVKTIDDWLLNECGFIHKQELGITDWNRKLIFYSKIKP